MGFCFKYSSYFSRSSAKVSFKTRGWLPFKKTFSSSPQAPIITIFCASSFWASRTCVSVVQASSNFSLRLPLIRPRGQKITNSFLRPLPFLERRCFCLRNKLHLMRFSSQALPFPLSKHYFLPSLVSNTIISYFLLRGIGETSVAFLFQFLALVLNI